MTQQSQLTYTFEEGPLAQNLLVGVLTVLARLKQDIALHFAALGIRSSFAKIRV